MLRKHDVKVKAVKCKLIEKKNTHLGRVISANVQTVHPKKIKVHNITELHRGFRLIIYFHHTILNFGERKKLMFDILKNSSLTDKSKYPIMWKKEHYVIEIIF